MFDFIMKNLKESHIKLKLVRNLCILKVFHLNIIKKKLNEFKETYKIIYYFLIFSFFFSVFPFLTFSLKFF